MLKRPWTNSTARWLVAAALTLAPFSSVYATPSPTAGIGVKDSVHSFQDVAFGSALIGLAAGDNGNIIRTTDGGKTWNSVSSGTGTQITHIQFGNSDSVAFASVSNGRILRSTDGGVTWTSTASLDNSSASALSVARDTYAYVGTALGHLYRTTDGTTWNLLGSPAGGSGITALSYTDTQNGMLAAGSSVYWTNDNGVNWTAVTNLTETITDVSMFGSTGYAVSAVPSVFKTTDAGHIWTKLDASSLSGGSLRRIYQPSASKVITVGTHGVASYSTDGGSSWIKMDAPTSAVGYTSAAVPTGATNAVFLSSSDGLSVYDSAAPGVIAGLAGNFAGSVTNNITPAFSWNAATDNVGPVTYWISIDNNAAINNDTLLSYQSPAGLSAGAHTFSVQAADEVNLLGAVSMVVFTVDTTGPSVSAVTPTSGTVNTTVTLHAHVTDAAGISGCSLLVNGAAIGAMVYDASSNDYIVNRSFSGVQNYTLKASCIDNAGNNSVGPESNFASTLTAVAPTPTPVPTNTTPSAIYSFISSPTPTVIADNSTSAIVTVVIKNNLAQPLPNKGVQLLSSRPGLDTITIIGNTTSDLGSAVFYVKSSAVGNSTLTATVDGISIATFPMTFTLASISPAPVTPPNSTIGPGSLVKYACPANAGSNDSCRAVYFIGSDNYRHAFPNSKIYFTWYKDFSDVRTISTTQLASYSLGKNVTYRPGVRMVKFTTGKFVYAVTKGGVLRWVTTETVAGGIYGNTWAKQIDDISDAFFGDYTFGADVTASNQFSSSAEQAAITSPLYN